MAKEYDRKFPFWDSAYFQVLTCWGSFRECTPKKRVVFNASVAEAFAASWFGAFILSFGGSQTSSDGLYRRRWLSSSLGPRQTGRLQTRLWKIQGGRRGRGFYPALISNTTPYFLRRRFKLWTDSGCGYCSSFFSLPSCAYVFCWAPICLVLIQYRNCLLAFYYLVLVLLALLHIFVLKDFTRQNSVLRARLTFQARTASRPLLGRTPNFFLAFYYFPC